MRRAVAAFLSLLIPGLGQLLQGRPLAALVHFVLALVLHLFFIAGLIMHVVSAADAWWYAGRTETASPR